MASLTPYPGLLRDLAHTARRTIGFFPAHNPRALEYPWILANLDADLNDWRILDVGAGVNPLPFALAHRGAQVTTLDSHALTRDVQTREQWNEWGFLDYARLDPRISSVRVAYEDYASASPFDAIYSVSVIEHVPANTRRAWIGQFAEQLTPGGLLLLSVDLVPGGEMLWNLSEGRVVESPEIHGDFSTLLNELREAGFAIESTDFQRAIPDSRVDVGFVRAGKAPTTTAA